MAKELTVSRDIMMEVQPTAYSQTCEIEIVGNIVNRQQYDGVEQAYSPDYTIRPCVLFPACSLIDPDNPNETGTCNAELDSFKWSEVTADGITVVASNETASIVSGYEAVTSGSQRGTLNVRKNSSVSTPRTMRFEGTWIDPQSGYKYTFICNKSMYVEDVTNARAELMLDSAPTVEWNPLRHGNSKKLTVKVMVGVTDKTADEKTKIWWYRLLDGGTRQLITSVDDADGYELTDVTKGDNGQVSSITIDCDLIGEGIGYEVRACYVPTGDVPTAPRDGDARKVTYIKRSIPPLAAKFIGSGFGVSADVGGIACQAVVSDNKGDMDKDVWNGVLRAKWQRITYGRKTSTDGTTTMTQSAETLGYGSTFVCPFAAQKTIRLVIEDRGPYNLVVDDDGNALVTESGEYIVARDIDETNG